MENKRVHGISEMPKENVGRRKRGMTAQVDFAHRREPSQVKSGFRRNEENGLGEVVLGGDGLEEGIGQP